MPVLDDATREYMLTDEFAARAKEVRQRMEAGERLSLGAIADALGLDFGFFAQAVAAEIMQQDRSVVGCFIEDDQALPAGKEHLQ